MEIMIERGDGSLTKPRVQNPLPCPVLRECNYRDVTSVHVQEGKGDCQS